MRYFISFLLIVFGVNSLMAQKPNAKKQFQFAEEQTEYMLQQIKVAQVKPGQVSPRTLEKGKLKMVNSGDWTSGFFAGELWFLYDFTRNPKWKNEAEKFTENLEKEQYNTGTHDLGFMIYCSYGNGFKATKNEKYKAVIIQAAKSLSKRFNPKTGVIRSWDHNGDKWRNPVIIDNMMNLELLFEASKLTGDSSFYKIAVSHANKTIKNHFRSDYSSYHVVDYNPETGEVIKKTTAQGYADDSSWARGQAWGLYGYTMCYRYTKNQNYLAQAKHIASYILNYPNLPKDKIPYWDYNDPATPNAPRDASAAAITASALYELYTFDKNSSYKKNADKILYSLSNNYQSAVKQNAGFILLHSTGHKPANSEIDVPINYADYYYLEALTRSKKAVKNL